MVASGFFEGRKGIATLRHGEFIFRKCGSPSEVPGRQLFQLAAPESAPSVKEMLQCLCKKTIEVPDAWKKE